jgi:hypothetical protein
MSLCDLDFGKAEREDGGEPDTSWYFWIRALMLMAGFFA